MEITTNPLLCLHCSKCYRSKANLDRHILICAKDPGNREKRIELIKKTLERQIKRRCKFCGKTFTRNYNLSIHEIKCGKIHECNVKIDKSTYIYRW